MKLFFQCKNPGVLKQPIEPVLLEIKDSPVNVSSLIKSIVEKVVEDFNKKIKNKPDDISTSEKNIEEFEIQNLSTTGRIAFGLIYNDKTISSEQAVTTALSGYEDGLFKIFINQELLGGPDSEISLKDGDLMTIVRLTFLSGRII